MIYQKQAPPRTVTDDRSTDRRIIPEELADATSQTDNQPIRTELVARIKRQIKLGIYDEETRIDALLDRLAAELLADETSSEPGHTETQPDQARRSRKTSGQS